MVDEHAAGDKPAETASAEVAGIIACPPDGGEAASPLDCEEMTAQQYADCQTHGAAALLFKGPRRVSVAAALAAGLKLFWITQEDPATGDEMHGFLIWGRSVLDACQLAQRVFHFDDAPPLWATELVPRDQAADYAQAVVEALDDDLDDGLIFKAIGEVDYLLYGDWEEATLIAPQGDVEFGETVRAELKKRLTECFRQFMAEMPGALEHAATPVKGEAYRWDGPALPEEADGSSALQPEAQP